VNVNAVLGTMWEDAVVVYFTCYYNYRILTNYKTSNYRKFKTLAHYSVRLYFSETVLKTYYEKKLIYTLPAEIETTARCYHSAPAGQNIQVTQPQSQPALQYIPLPT
jgi:hypothetical protein